MVLYIVFSNKRLYNYDMNKICEICEKEFESNNKSRIYCYECSGESSRLNNATRKHQKTVLRRSMKLQAIKLLGGKCSICGYNRCTDALEFHHQNPYEKDFKLGSGNTMSWREYKKEALKCILVCSNCHKELHSKLGYIYS